MPRKKKGCPSGPGRPKGSRNKATVWLDRLGRDGAETIVEVVKQKASEGDMRACALMMARFWPALRGRTLELDLPPVGDAAGLVAAQAEIVACLGRAEVTADEAASISNLLENQRRAIEMHDYGRRLEKLERKAADTEGKAEPRSKGPHELLPPDGDQA